MTQGTANHAPHPSHVRTLEQFKQLLEIVQKLRGPDGCPWDKEQTQKSLAAYSIEEAYELAEAIEAGNSQDVREELGDFLFQVLLQSQVAEDAGDFNMADVIQRLNEKMLHRHPHVFGDVGTRSIDQVWLHWDKLKAKEHAKPKPVFSYPRKMPALQAAHKIGVKTEGYNFDWEKPEQVFEKIEEEISELREALAGKDLKQLEHEIGDVLFSVSQLARHLGLEAEQCLRAGNRRFENRFNQVLKISGLGKDEFRELPPAEMEKLWQQAKKETE